MKYTSLTISQLLSQQPHENLWVLNTTSGEKRAMLVIGLSAKDGARESLRVPVTWLPLNLTEQHTRESILQSPNFRRALAQGAITAITEEQAMAEFSREGAEEERARVRRIDSGAMTDDAITVAEAAGTELEGLKDVPAVVQGFATMIENSNDTEAAAEFRSLGDLNKPSLEFLFSVAKRLNYATLARYVAEELKAK